ISSSRSTPGYTFLSACSRSSRSTARPSAFSVPRSPPEPLTHRSSTSSPVTGSFSAPLAEVLPPAKLVFRLSAPRRLEREISSSTVLLVLMLLCAPSGLLAAHAVLIDLFLVAAGLVGSHRVRGQAAGFTPPGQDGPDI